MTYRIVAPDSGQVYTITDSLLEPHTQYDYRVDAYTRGPNMPRNINTVNDAAVTSREPYIFAFSVVHADTVRRFLIFLKESWSHRLISPTSSLKRVPVKPKVLCSY